MNKRGINFKKYGKVKKRNTSGPALLNFKQPSTKTINSHKNNGKKRSRLSSIDFFDNLLFKNDSIPQSLVDFLFNIFP